MPPCLSLRDWYESGKSSHSDQAYRLPYLPTLVSPFHAEPLQSLETLFSGWDMGFCCVVPDL